MRNGKEMKTKIQWLGVWVVLMALGAPVALWAQMPNVDLKPKITLDKKRYQPGSLVKGRVAIDIPKPYHTHANPPSEDFYIATELKFSASKAFQVKSIQYPKPTEFKFKFSEKPLKVYEGKGSIQFTLQLESKASLGNLPLSATLRYQACDDNACYPPQNKEIKTTLVIAKEAAATEDNPEYAALVTPEENASAGTTAHVSVKATDTSQLPLDQKIKVWFDEGRWGQVIGGLFLGGLLLNLTPCVFPLIPITLGFFGMQSRGQSAKRIGLSTTYALSIAITYALLGTVAALAGKTLGFQFQNPIFVGVLTGIIVLLALSMFDVYKLQVPPLLMRYVGGKQGFTGAMMMGGLAGVAAAPCIGPVIGVLIPIIAGVGNPLYGFLLFFALGMGLGAPYLVLGLFYDRLQGRMPRSGEWTVLVERIFGVALIAVAIYFGKTLVPAAAYPWLWVGFFAFFAVYFLFFDKKDYAQQRVIRLKQLVGVVMIGLMLQAGYSMFFKPVSDAQIVWESYSQAAIDQAKSEGKPVLIDFTADWCAACHELDKYTYTDAKVVAEADRFVRLKHDSTKETPESQAIWKQYEIVGLPTVILIDSQGKEVRSLRLTGFEGAEAFLKRLQSVE